jgi:hypothetical protein
VRNYFFLFSFLISWGFSLPALAQTPSQVETSRLQQQNDQIKNRNEADLRQENETTETIAVSPGDEDLGVQQILKREEKYKAFSLFGDISGHYTNNVALTKKDTFSDYFLVGLAGASWRPKVTDTLYAEVSAVQKFFRYDEFNNLDFDSLDLGSSITWFAPWVDGLSFGLRYNFNRLVDAEENQEFFKNHTITPGVSYTWIFSRAHYLYTGVSSELGFSDPYAAQRDDHGLYLGYRVEITRNFSADLYTRLSYLKYDANDREDLNHIVNIALEYKFNEWVSLSGSGNYAQNFSKFHTQDYRALGSSASLNLKYEF